VVSEGANTKRMKGGGGHYYICAETGRVNYTGKSGIGGGRGEREGRRNERRRGQVAFCSFSRSFCFLIFSYCRSFSWENTGREAHVVDRHEMSGSKAVVSGRNDSIQICQQGQG
jgi:hypothetical protein